MRIAVVGANGFVGRHLTRFLSNQGVTAIPVSRPDLAPQVLVAALAGCDALVNCAGEKNGTGAAAREANVLLPLRLLDAAISANIPVMVQVSSVAALNSTTGPGETITDEYSGHPTGAYGMSKREGDDAVLKAARERSYGGVAVLRPPILIGHDAEGVFALLRSMARAGIPLPLAGAANRRSVMHVDNFAAAILAAVESRCSGAFVVTDSSPLSSADLYRRMLLAAGHGRRLFGIGNIGRSLLQKAMGVRGDSLFGDAAFAGDRFGAAVGRIDWPVPPTLNVERAMIADS